MISSFSSCITHYDWSKYRNNCNKKPLKYWIDLNITICEISMDITGFKREEMIDYPNLNYGEVAAFLKEAAESKVQLFIHR